MIGGGEYLIALGTDIYIDQANTLLGTNIPGPHDVAPKAFPRLPKVKFCR